MTDGNEIELRVYYQDTDAGGVVYHANYLAFAERGRMEFLRALGLSPSALAEREGLVFVVAGLSVAFRAPAVLDDLLTVRTSVEQVGGASFGMRQEILRRGAVLAELDVKLVAVDRGTFRAVRLPEAVGSALRAEIRPPPPSS